MKILIAVLMTWLSANFDLPMAREQPEVRFATRQQMTALRYGATTVSHGRDLIAVYEDRTQTIFLAEGWTGQTPAEVSVLVQNSCTTCRTCDS